MITVAVLASGSGLTKPGMHFMLEKCSLVPGPPVEQWDTVEPNATVHSGGPRVLEISWHENTTLSCLLIN